MSKSKQDLVRKLKELNKTPAIITVGEVKAGSLNLEELTCSVIPSDGGPEIFDVRFKAAIDEVTDGLVQIPVEGSTVLVARIANEESEQFLLAVSEVQEVLFFRGQNGGLVKWPDAKAQLDKVKELLTAVVNVLNGAPIAEPGNGSPSALQASLKGAIADKQLPSFEDLENEKVKH